MLEWLAMEFLGSHILSIDQFERTDIEKITIDDAVSLLEEKLKVKKGAILKKTKIINKKTTRKKKS